MTRPWFGEGKFRVNFKHGSDAKIEFTFLSLDGTLL